MSVSSVQPSLVASNFEGKMQRKQKGGDEILNLLNESLKWLEKGHKISIHYKSGDQQSDLKFSLELTTDLMNSTPFEAKQIMEKDSQLMTSNFCVGEIEEQLEAINKNTFGFRKINVLSVTFFEDYRSNLFGSHYYAEPSEVSLRAVLTFSQRFKEESDLISLRGWIEKIVESRLNHYVRSQQSTNRFPLVLLMATVVMTYVFFAFFKQSGH